MSQDALLFVQYDKRAAHRNPGIVYLIGRLGVEPSSRSYACDWLAPAHTTVMLTPVERRYLHGAALGCPYLVIARARRGKG